MAANDLNQAEADYLLRVEKVRITEEPYDSPGIAGSLELPIAARDGREDFLLNIIRGRISLTKCVFQLRARIVVVLARLDIDGPAHQNPDGTILGCPHIHLYREGFGDKWAFDAAKLNLSKSDRLDDVYHKFCDFCSIIEPPILQGGLF